MPPVSTMRVSQRTTDENKPPKRPHRVQARCVIDAFPSAQRKSSPPLLSAGIRTRYVAGVSLPLPHLMAIADGVHCFHMRLHRFVNIICVYFFICSSCLHIIPLVFIAAAASQRTTANNTSCDEWKSQQFLNFFSLSLFHSPYLVSVFCIHEE